MDISEAAPVSLNVAKTKVLRVRKRLSWIIKEEVSRGAKPHLISLQYMCSLASLVISIH